MRKYDVRKMNEEGLHIPYCICLPLHICGLCLEIRTKFITGGWIAALDAHGTLPLRSYRCYHIAVTLRMYVRYHPFWKPVHPPTDMWHKHITPLACRPLVWVAALPLYPQTRRPWSRRSGRPGIMAKRDDINRSEWEAKWRRRTSCCLIFLFSDQTQQWSMLIPRDTLWNKTKTV